MYKLLEAAKELLSVLEGFLELGKLLGKFYIPTRYVDAWSEGVSFEYSTRGDAEAALAASEKDFGVCRRVMESVFRSREALRARALALAKAAAEALPGTVFLVGSFARATSPKIAMWIF